VRLRHRHRRSHVKWVCATTAPWALACGLLISFTATAANDSQSGVSAIGLSPLAQLVDSMNLIPSVGASSGLVRAHLDLGRDILQARLGLEVPDESELSLDQLPPRADLKSQATASPVGYPIVDRTLKGDPVIALRPTLSRRAGDVRQTPGSRLMFGRDERLLPPTVLMLGSPEAPDMDGRGFEPWTGTELTSTGQAMSVQSPAAAAAGSTGAAASTTTPSVSRAISLSSTTPAPAEATPVEIAAAPVSPLQSPRLDQGAHADATVAARLDHGAHADTTVAARLDHGAHADTTVATRTDPDRPRYADLVNPDKVDSEQRCLAEAVYFEARSEPEEGQAAVAQVVLNRVRSGLYPGSICGVVYQNRHRHLACQFTFACEGKALRIGDRESWDTAKRVAGAVLEGRTYLADVGGATHYHADYVKPSWSRRLKKMDVIGRHIFYKLRPGQT
jgi:spore germination cell wall hydrolase CwlJ-like protein